MQRMRSIIVSVIIGLGLASASAARAQSTEERFHDLFVTAGYATAFGAAVGTAFLAWTADPSANLRYVAMGASLGFIGGSVLGSYIIFSPMITDNGDVTSGSLVATNAIPEQGFVIRPTWDRETKRVAAVEGGMTLLKF